MIPTPQAASAAGEDTRAEAQTPEPKHALVIDLCDDDSSNERPADLSAATPPVPLSHTLGASSSAPSPWAVAPNLLSVLNSTYKRGPAASAGMAASPLLAAYDARHQQAPRHAADARYVSSTPSDAQPTPRPPTAAHCIGTLIRCAMGHGVDEHLTHVEAWPWRGPNRRSLYQNPVRCQPVWFLRDTASCVAVCRSPAKPAGSGPAVADSVLSWQ